MPTATAAEAASPKPSSRAMLSASVTRAGVESDLVVVVGQHVAKIWWCKIDAQPQQVIVHLHGHPVQAGYAAAEQQVAEQLV